MRPEVKRNEEWKGEKRIKILTWCKNCEHRVAATDERKMVGNGNLDHSYHKTYLNVIKFIIVSDDYFSGSSVHVLLLVIIGNHAFCRPFFRATLLARWLHRT
jgi:hypothetical protein